MSYEGDYRVYWKLRHQLSLFETRPGFEDAPDVVLRKIRKEVEEVGLFARGHLKTLTAGLLRLIAPFEYAALLPRVEVAALVNEQLLAMAGPREISGLYELYVTVYLMATSAQVVTLYFWKIPGAFPERDMRPAVLNAFFAGLRRLGEFPICGNLQHSLCALVSQYALAQQPGVNPLVFRIFRWPSPNVENFRLSATPSELFRPYFLAAPPGNVAISVSLASQGIRDDLHKAPALYPVLGRQGVWVLGLQTSPSGFGRLVLVTRSGIIGERIYCGKLNLTFFAELKLTVVQDAEEISVFWESSLVTRVRLSPEDVGEGALHLGPVTEAKDWSPDYAAVATQPLRTEISGKILNLEFNNVWGVAFPVPALLVSKRRGC